MQMQTVQTMMAEVGRVADLMVVVEYEEERTWHLAVAEGRQIFVELDAPRGLLVFSSPLPKPDPAAAAAFYELALRLNFAWEATEGLRLALDAPAGAFTVIADVAVAALDPEILGRRLRHFDGQARAIGELLARRAVDGDDLMHALSTMTTFRA